MTALVQQPAGRIPRNLHRVLSTGDVARIRGTSRVAAWKWLTRMEKKYGAEHVRRLHGTMRIALTVASYRHIQVAEGANAVRLYQETARLRALVEEQGRRLNGLAGGLGDLSRRLRALESRGP